MTTRIIGVDPGIVRTGVVLLEAEGGRVRVPAWAQLRGGTGLSRDFPGAVVAARSIADGLIGFIAGHLSTFPEAVVVESFTDQGAARRGRSLGSWLTVMVCQAIHDRFADGGLERALHWQTNSPALNAKNAGQYVDAARFGRLQFVSERGGPAGHSGPRSLPEHAADALGHALYFHDQGGRLGAMMR